jgi:hypothetical protein
MRQAMRSTPRPFDSLEQAIGYVAPRVSAPNDLRSSWFVRRGKQTRLDAF